MDTIPENPQPQNSPTTPRAYSYVRFSSPAQAEGDSLRRQQEASERYAAEKGLTLDDSLKADSGISAFRRKNALKGNLSDFLQKVEDGAIPLGSVLIVENLDRLSRAPIMESTEIINRILLAGIDIVTLSDGIRHRAEEIRNNAYAYMLPVMSLCRAYEESKNKSRRVGAAWANKRKRTRDEGHILTARGPGWLRKTPTGWEVIPERAAIVARIYSLALQGLGKFRIARLLNDESVPHFETRKRKGAGWHPTYIARLLNERKVLGEIQLGKSTEDGKRIPDGPPIPGYYPPIIDESDWLKVNQRQKPSAGRPSNVINLFQGLLRDGYTNAPMHFVTKGQKESHHSQGIWLISDSKRLGSPCADNWPYAHFERLALKFLRELNWSAIRAEGKSDDQHALETEEAIVKAELAKTETAQNRVLEAFRSTATPPAILAKELERLEEESTALQTKLVGINRQISSIAAASNSLAGTPNLECDDTPETHLRLRAEIRRRVKAIHVYTQGLPTKEGIIITPSPSIEIELSNGVSRFVIAGRDNQFPKSPMPKLQPRAGGKFRKMTPAELAAVIPLLHPNQT